MIVKETLYVENITDKSVNKMRRLTPNNYWRHSIYKSDDYLGVLESQLLAEFLGYSDFNNISDEKYIEII